MIGKSDENSRSWVEDIYWTHFKALHFAQFLRTGYDQHLVLPKTFSDNVKKLPENVDLRGPSGVVWNVGLTSKDDTVFFMNGWRQFFKDHSLKEHDFLVFKYNGEALFDVLIFDGGSFCEKASSYFVRKSGYTENGGACLITGEVTDNSVPNVHALSNAGVQCASPEKSVDVNDFMVLEDLTFKTPTERAFNAGVKSAPPEKFMEADEVAEPAAVSPQTTGKRTRKQRYAVKSIGTVRRGRAENGSSGYAVKPIRTVRRGRAANGSSDNQEIVDLVTGEKSVVGNDFMVLEDVTFKTPTEKAFDAGVESASPEKFMEADEVAEPAAVSPQTTGKRTRKQRYAVKPIRTVRRRRAANGSNDNQEVVDLVTDPEPADPGRPDPEPASVSKSITYSSNRRPVTEDEIKNALELARAACTSSSLHIVMRPTHVYKRFFVSVPNKWILEHISPESQNVILRVGGIEWLAKYSLHNVRHTGGLTGGWKHFAVDNNLEEFDVCVLEPAGQINNTLILDVSIFRVVEEITPLGVVGTPGKRGRNK